MTLLPLRDAARRGPLESPPAKSVLRSAFARGDERSFVGFVVDPDDLGRRFTVEILLDGYPIRTIRADAFVHDLAREGVGDARYGFGLTLDMAAAADGGFIEARLANLGAPVGEPIAVDQIPDRPDGLRDPGEVHWTGGLHFSGWIGEAAEPEPLTALVDGMPIARVASSSWRHLGTAENVRAVRGVDFHLPRRFADGCVHQLSLLTARDEHLRGSPSLFLALPHRFREALEEIDAPEARGLAAELLDRLLPTSAPFSHYESCRRTFPMAPGPSQDMRIAMVLIGSGAVDETLESLQQQTHHDWVAAALPATPVTTGFQPEHMRVFLSGEAAQSDVIVLALAGTQLAPTALQRIANAFAGHRQASVLYGDVDLRAADGSAWPLALPAFDYERMLEQGYCAHIFAMRRPAVERSLDAGAMNLYRLFNAVLDDDSTDGASIVHLPGALGLLPHFDIVQASAALADASRAHLQRRGRRAAVKATASVALPAVRVTRTSRPPRATLVVTARNHGRALALSLSSILPAAKKLRAELLVVDNDSGDPETLDLLAQIDGRIARVLRVPGDFNAARLLNRAAEVATGEALCLLGHPVRALDETWLEELLGRITEGSVGAAGALVSWPSGVVRHAGAVLGPNFAAVNAFSDRMASDFGYGDLLRVGRECSAVSGTGLVTRRADFLDVGGMDELRFPAYFGDVDFCLKLRALGKRIVFTPHARLELLGSAPRGGAGDETFEAELRSLRNRWGHTLAADPYYNPTLSLDPVPFSALAWPPRGRAARFNERPAAVVMPDGF